MGFKYAMAAKDLWSGELRQVVVDGRKVLLVKVDDRVYAYDDRCAHLGASLSEGTMSGPVITCPAHHWQYDACSGRGINPKSAKLKSYPVRLDADEICVDLEGEANDK
jgi:toluene monooxygenase system ferredoxin subunit